MTLRIIPSIFLRRTTMRKGDGRKMQHGESATEGLMKFLKVPMTRENFLRLNSPDGEVYDPTPEEEANFPARFRTPEPEPKVHQNPENKEVKEPAVAKAPDWDTLLINAKRR
jgi:hypothetical protein